MTPIQELIQEMEELKKTKLYKESFKAIDDCIYLALAKLQMEKKQIILAHGIKDIGVNNMKCVTGEQYYNETFKSE